MDEEQATGAVDAVDTSNTGTESGDSSEETGGVSAEEIAAALGPKYKTVAPVADTEDETDAADDTTDDEVEDEDEADAEPEKPAKEASQEKSQEVTADTPDFSFTVEDANGQTVKIAPGDSIEDVLKDFEPRNNGQIIAILDQLREAKDNAAKYEADQQAAKDAEAKSQQITTIQEGWDKEFDQLGIKEESRRADIFQYMAKANDERSAAGRPLIASIEDAKLGLEAQEAKAAAEQAKKDAKDTARKNGGLVGGSSAPASSGNAAYKAGSARNVNQAIRNAGLL